MTALRAAGLAGLVAMVAVAGAAAPPASALAAHATHAPQAAWPAVVGQGQSDPAGVVCEKVALRVVEDPLRLDRQWVDPGTYTVYEAGTTCARATGLVDQWLADGRTGDGFRHYSDADAGDGDQVLDPCVHMFTHHHDTTTRFDNDVIKLVPLECEPREGQTNEVGAMRVRPSGSTVIIGNQNPTYVLVTPTTPAQESRLLPAAQDPRRIPARTITNRGSTDLDVRAVVDNGSETSLRVVRASSDFARHLVGAYDVRSLLDFSCEYMLNIDETRTCTSFGRSWTFTRLINDTANGGTRYQYQVLVDFSARTRGSSVNVINGGSQPVRAYLSGSSDQPLLQPGQRRTFVTLPAESNAQVIVERATGTVQDRSTIRLVHNDTGHLANWLFTQPSGAPGQLLLEASAPGETRTAVTAGGGTLTFTRLVNDVTPRPDTSSNRYQYDAVVAYP